MKFENESGQERAEELIAGSTDDANEAVAPARDAIITLPPGASLEDLSVEGRDLIVTLADGSRIVITDGAVYVPALAVDGVVVQSETIVQLLAGNEPEPAAGPPQSSGGNFAANEGAIQAAFDIGDLLPFTALSFPDDQEEEIIPAVDDEPEVLIETIDNPTGVENAIATVDEDGLPERGGTDGEPEGTRADTNSETTSGTIVFVATDGLDGIFINGEELSGVGQTFTTPLGTLTVTEINLATGRIDFTYTLGDNTLSDVSDAFTVLVVDKDGDEAVATLNILITDDGPIAADDLGVVPAGTHAPISGDVLANDVPGADDYAPSGAVQGFSQGAISAEPGETIQGQYGTLTLNSDGTYTYTRDLNTPGGVEENFDYTIVDSDGSTSTATLTIRIGNAPNIVTEVPRIGDNTIVFEGALAPRNGEPVGSGEIADGDPDNDSDPTENIGGIIRFNSPDGVESVMLHGIIITPNALPQTIFSDGTGTLVVTGYTYDPVTGNGTITYEFTLTDNTAGDDTSVEIDIRVTDLDGDIAMDTIIITIVDDEPEAIDDSASQVAENAPVSIDVLANDTVGADDVDPSDVALVAGTLSGSGTIVYNGDGTFTYTPGPGEEGTVTFDYSITDGDGDVSVATATLNLLPDSVPEIGAEGDTAVDEAGLAERGSEPAGSDAAADSEFANGLIFIDTGNDTVGTLFINGVNVTNGGTVTTSKGVLTVTLTGTQYSYSYQLTDNTLADPDSDTFAVTVTDSDGDSASTTIVIAILDDAPIAEDDAGTLLAGQYGPIGGNVIDNDTEGADGAKVTSYTGDGGTGATGTTVQGLYGTLTIAADGTYSYTRNPGTPGGVSDSFTYTITDGDGDTSSAKLVIEIRDSRTTLDLPTAGEDGTIVDEAGLAGPPAGSDAASDSETTAGSFTYTAPDGPATVTIDGVAVTTIGQTFTGTFGTLQITAIANGSISYTYTLTTNTAGDTTSDTFDVRVTDVDGDFSEDTLEIAIVDDVPTAAADRDSVTEDGPLVADGNVLTGTGGTDANGTDGAADVEGADQATVTGVAFGDVGADVADNVGTGVAGNYGSLQIDADGEYVYTLDNTNALVQGLDDTETLTETFTYTITDGDGDTSTTTVTITINGKDDPVVITGLDLAAPELVFAEDDLADGSSPNAAVLTKTGTFDVSSQDGLVTLTVGGITVFDANAATTYPVTIADPVYGLLTITGVATTTDANGDVVSATVSYSYTLQDNSLLHTGGNNGSFTDSFAVVATDTDGSTDTASLDIAIVDDVPTAEDDVATQADENQPFEIDAFANDEFGADNVDTTDATKVFVSTQASQGTVTYDTATGKFTYTPDPDAGSGGNVSDFFEYTIIDADGDTSTARVDVTLQPDSEPEANNATALVDDDGLTGNNPLSNLGDLDANAGDDPADTSEASFTGMIGIFVGNDVPADVAFAASLDGSTASVGQETVTYSVAGMLLTATITGGVRDGTALFTVEITDPATGDYTVTLLDNVIHAAGSDENNASVSLGILLTDSDLDTASAILTIVFDDDAPTATDNSNMVDEGSLVTGNVLTDDSGDGVDASGADGYGANGAVIELASVTSGGSTTTIDGSGNLVISTALGTLTVNAATGAYTYQSNTNSTNADAVDEFTYTIVDGDGDEVTATLAIDVTNAPGQVSDNEVSVNEAGLPGGSDPLSDSEIDADGQITVVGATGTLVYTLLSPVNGVYGTLALNSATGEYTYTLDTPFTDAVDENGTNVVNGAESFNYEVRDTLGNLIGTGSIDVSIVDDIPAATDQTNINVAEDVAGTISGNVMTDGTPDTEGADGATVTAITIDGNETAVPQDGTDAVVVTAKGTYTIDMDGNWTFDPNPNQDHTAGNISAGFNYTLTDGDGDFDTAVQPITITDGKDPAAGPDIDLALDDQNLADGSTPGATSDSDTIVFTQGSDNIASIVFGDVSGLGGGLTWTRVSDTQIIGEDGGRLVVTLNLSVVGTSATVTATLNDNYDDHPTIDLDDLVDLGDVDVIAEDIDGDTATATVSVSVSDDLPSISASAPSANGLTVDETDLATNASTDFSGLFTADANADSPGSVGGYTLGINPGATGLVDTATNEAVVLSMNGTVVEGRTAGTNALVFTVSVNAATGLVTLDQQRAVKHADTNDDNDPETLNAANLITLSATITDSDGDTATATANIAGAITFLDDGPALSNVLLGSSVSVDETDGLTASATSAASILSFVADYGEDGGNAASFAINITDANSGLATAVGDYPITLVQTSATVITGVFDNGSGNQTAFTVTINANGTITLTQNVALEHLIDGDNTAGEHNDTLNLAGKISATVKITDGDGDTDSATVPVGAALTFFDDGPSVTLSGVNDSLSVSDSNYAADDSDNFADNFSFDGGEDGIAGTSFALSAANGSVSGLIDTATGNGVFLFLESGAVVGRAGADAGSAATGQEVFRVTVDSLGNVTLDQSRAVDHALSTGSNGSAVSLASDGLIQLIGTVTDTDGDTSSKTLDIGSNLSFTDDTPAAGNNNVVLLDDDALGGNPGGTNDDVNAAFTTGTLDHDFGNDSGAIAFDLGSAAPAGFQFVSNGSNGVLIQQDQGSGFVTVITVTLNPATGAYTVTQNLNILHPDGDTENNVEFSLDYIVTDGDNDTATSTLVINVDDDTPIALSANSQGRVDEDGLPGGIAGGVNDAPGEDVVTTGSVTGLFAAGADAPLTYSLSSNTSGLLALTSGGVAVTYSVSGDTLTALAGTKTVFTFTLNAMTGAWEFELLAPLDHAPGDDENVPDIRIDFQSIIYATDADGDPVSPTGLVRVTVDDDSPVANNDTNSLGEDTASVGGNVLTDGVDDGFGGDGPGNPAIISISGFGGAGTVDGSTTGEWGTLTLNANGSYTYNLDTARVQGLDDGETETDTFTYTIIDADGDPSEATLKITINGANDAPVAVADTNWTVEDAAAATTGNVLQNQAHPGAPSGVFADAADTDVDGETLSVTTVGTFNGTYGILTLNADGTYSYSLYTAAQNPAAFNAVQALDQSSTPLVDTFNYTASDGTASNGSTLTISIFGANDAPMVVGSVTVVSEEGLPGGLVDSVGTPTDITNSLAASGQITITDADDTAFTVTLGIPTTPGLTSGGLPISWQVSPDGKSLVGSTTAGTVILVGINDTGNWTVNLVRPIDHSNTAAEDISSFNIPVSVSDGTATTTIPNGIAVTVEDDSPLAAISASGLNISHDETAGIQGDAQDVTGPLTVFDSVANKGDDPHVSGSVIGFAQDLSGLVSTGTGLGGDGAGSTTFSLNVSAAGVDSGLDTTEGANILLYNESGIIVGRVGGPSGAAAFAVAVDTSTGAVSLVQYLSIKHPTGGLSSPDETVSIVNGAITATVTATDADGDTKTATTSIGSLISFQDDAGSLGAFTPSTQTITNDALETAGGTFVYETGSDGHGTFNITGPALTGVVYQPLFHGLVDATDDGVNNPTAQGTLLTATNTDGTVTLFTIAADVNGNFKYTLVTPDAGSTQTISLLGLTPGGPTPFVETSDGRVEFTANGSGVNSSTQGFGVSNQFVASGENFTIEFHNPGQPGNQAPLTDPEYVSSAVLTNDGSGGGSVVYRITVFNDALGVSEVVYTGTIPGASTLIDPTGIDTFNRILVEGISGSGQGARFTSFSYSKTILPSDLDLTFQINAVDGDGDVTSTSSVNIMVDASVPASSSSASTAAYSSMQVPLDDQLDISSYTGSGSGNSGNGSGRNSVFGMDSMIAIQEAYRSDLRMSEMTLVAALSGAILFDQANTAGGDMAGIESGAASYDLAAIEGMMLEPSLPQTETSDTAAMLGLLGAGDDATAASAEWNGLGAESALATSPEMSLMSQAEPLELEAYVDDVAGGSALDPSALFGEATGDVDQAMEALLTIQPNAEALADLSGNSVPVDGLAEHANSIIVDIAIEAALDNMIEELTDASGASDYLVAQAGALDMGLLDQMLDSAMDTGHSLAIIDTEADEAAAALAAA